MQPGAISSFEPDGPAFVNAFQAVTNAYDGLTEVSLPADLQDAARQLRTKGLPALPALAASWESDARRLVWRFRLRPGVRSAPALPVITLPHIYCRHTCAACLAGMYAKPVRWWQQIVCVSIFHTMAD